eukprot:TRINITY_DN8893_c0_g1_i3.p1 TRINITY_DN8893_c0_g1~~TRINITY_DN8893_c0_g1_i3.p1  ORF type:complete len:360 (+),score=41.48 TRINITY_DN8893_c0_g1_i3:76-1155(+)
MMNGFKLCVGMVLIELCACNSNEDMVRASSDGSMLAFLESGLDRVSVLMQSSARKTGAKRNVLSEEEQMALLASAAYHPELAVPGWKLALNFTLASSMFRLDGLDIFSIFSTQGHDSQCALVFSGTNDALDVRNDLDGRWTDMCGFKGVHRGFARALSALLNSSAWSTRFVPLLASSSCKGGVRVVGHSLGAAQASIFSACANNGSRPYGFYVKSLWNFGGPGITRNQLSNNESSDGCFDGSLFWNEDAFGIDPIVVLSRSLLYQHEKIAAVRLTKNANGYSMQSYACNFSKTAIMPQFLDGLPNPLLHTLDEYVYRVDNIFTQALGKEKRYTGWNHRNSAAIIFVGVVASVVVTFCIV